MDLCGEITSARALTDRIRQLQGFVMRRAHQVLDRRGCCDRQATLSRSQRIRRFESDPTRLEAQGRVAGLENTEMLRDPVSRLAGALSVRRFPRLNRIAA